MEGSSIKEDLPWLLAKRMRPGSWWGNCTPGLGRRVPAHPEEAPEPGSLAALAVPIGNDVPAASSARAAHRRDSPSATPPAGGRQERCR